MQLAMQTVEARLFGRILLVGLSVWLHAADTLVTATLAPAIVLDLGGVVYINWLLTIYEVGAVISGAATGMAAERLGIRAVYLGATCLYGVGCLAAALAQGTAVLLLARLLQGLGGGALLTLSYVAIYQWFGRRWWNRMFGIVAVVWGTGSLLGPLIGGLFASGHLWRDVFLIFLGLSAVLGILVMVLSPAETRSAGEAARWPLGSLSMLTAATLLIAQSGVLAEMRVSLACCATGLVLLYLAARIDAGSEVRLLPRQLLDLRTPLGAGLLMIFAMAVGTTAFWTYGPLLLKTLFNLAPIVSGYLFALEAVAWTLGTVWITARPVKSESVLIRVGVFIVAAGAAGFALSVPEGSLSGMTVCAIAQGLGFGLAWPAIVTRIVSLAPAEEVLASTATATLQRIGYAVGTAFAGVLAKAGGLTGESGLQAARSAGFWVFAGFVPMLAFGVWSAFNFSAGGARVKPPA